ncbi:MAG: accessory Sec system translocase SecA2 [Clostridia bacterium]|nr:accessory Sec system translocase SecA2 [Clostridia bacterium]
MVNKKNIEYDLKPLYRVLTDIKKNISEGCDKEQITEKSKKLKERASGGEPVYDMLPEAFALVFMAARQALGIDTHDVQLLAAVAMADGRIIELATGEGKTLAAVFPAYLMALSGKGSHVLTANDYLAQRDALWMKPVYGLLDMSVSSIGESSDRASRKSAYEADITYVTAKEAGFDYLRGFLAFDPDELLQRPFNFAVIDEADSTLIDEARIPLVISGEIPSALQVDINICNAVRKMQRGTDYKTDDYETIIYLEESGIAFLEKELRLRDIYDDKNLNVLEKAEAILQAEFLLHRDVDYIVRDGDVLIVDKVTGRIAQNRQWTDKLQAAVEMKEGLVQKANGIVMNSITPQNFLCLYPDFCGMTGTACPAAPEFLKFYHKSVTVIPPDRPCIRADYPDLIFADKNAKYRALAAEIKKAHIKGQPVLIGTCSIEESEHLASLLRDDTDNLAVLNAKNDADEAGIIAEAGKPGAVTISTNMAGRGVDIRLGGTDAADYDKVCALGGLYVIGTNRHESVRIDNQLRGRAGRQGDPGMSRFFISLEDDLLIKYGLSGVIPEKYRNTGGDCRLQNKELEKAVRRVQGIAEVQIFDAKTTLAKYSRVVEDQRLLVHEKRMEILFGSASLSILEKEAPEKCAALLSKVSETEFDRARRQIELFALGKCWSDHLIYIDSVMDEISMISAVKADPLVYYNRKLLSGFEQLEKRISEVVLDLYNNIIIRDGRIDLEEMAVKGPTSTKTYLVHDGTELFDFMGGAGMIGSAAFAAPLFFLNLLFEKLRRSKNGG